MREDLSRAPILFVNVSPYTQLCLGHVVQFDPSGHLFVMQEDNFPGNQYLVQGQRRPQQVQPPAEDKRERSSIGRNIWRYEVAKGNGRRYVEFNLVL